MLSKPTIDIAGVVRSIDDVLGELDVCTRPDTTTGASSPALTTTSSSGRSWRESARITFTSSRSTRPSRGRLAFCDHLRTDTGVAAQYAAAKRDPFA